MSIESRLSKLEREAGEEAKSRATFSHYQVLLMGRGEDPGPPSKVLPIGEKSIADLILDTQDPRLWPAPPRDEYEAAERAAAVTGGHRPAGVPTWTFNREASNA